MGPGNRRSDRPSRRPLEEGFEFHGAGLALDLPLEPGRLRAREARAMGEDLDGPTSASVARSFAFAVSFQAGFESASDSAVVAAIGAGEEVDAPIAANHDLVRVLEFLSSHEIQASFEVQSFRGLNRTLVPAPRGRAWGRA